MCKSSDNLYHCLHTVICVLLCFRRNLDHDWLLCWTLTYSNCVAPSAVTWKLKTQRNTGLNQRSCWTNWLTFICSWIVLALLKQLLMIRWAPERWRRRAKALWTNRTLQNILEAFHLACVLPAGLSYIPTVCFLPAGHLCSYSVCSL